VPQGTLSCCAIHLVNTYPCTLDGGIHAADGPVRARCLSNVLITSAYLAEISGQRVTRLLARGLDHCKSVRQFEQACVQLNPGLVIEQLAPVALLAPIRQRNSLLQVKISCI